MNNNDYIKKYYCLIFTCLMLTTYKDFALMTEYHQRRDALMRLQ